jgi:hypothetical protein
MGEENGAVEPTGQTQLDRTQISADVGTLADFKNLVSQELELNLRPAVESIGQDQQSGATFARNIPSDQLFRARMQYFNAQQTSMTALHGYIDLAEILMRTIDRIIVEYDSANSGASIDMLRVNQIFAEESTTQAPAEKRNN